MRSEQMLHSSHSVDSHVLLGHWTQQLPQPFLFDAANDHWLTIDQTAEALGVSSASIRNWIKTGCLATDKHRRIRRESFEAFRREIAGVDKLTARANKSLADGHNHQALQARFTRELEAKRGLTGDQLSNEYEAGLSDSFRNKEGIYYTPDEIAGTFLSIFQRIGRNLRSAIPVVAQGTFSLRL